MSQVNKDTLSLTLPVLLGYIPLGMTFGFLMASQGFSWYFVPLFSLFAYSGAMQFIAIPLLVQHTGYLDLALTTLLVNFRHIFYGMSLLHLQPFNMLKRIYFIFGITDETYSLLSSAKGIDPHNAFFIVLLNHVYWVLGSLFGAILASQMMPIKGIEFVLTALFCILLIEQFKKIRLFSLIVIGLLACLIAKIIYPDSFLVIASIISLVILYIDFKHQCKSSEVGAK